ncbi:MAG: hypothetical protein MZU84_06185 [Sphingobacterium sp.]|nr:hypothetical protein [Sphingobacterium sp.]
MGPYPRFRDAPIGRRAAFALQWKQRTEMSHRRRRSVLAAALAATAALVPRPASAQDLIPGRVVERVACLAEAGRSYALYLPSGFDAGKTWPLLVLFDPAARGSLAVEAFREAAEAHGWILAASNDSRNGPLQDSARAAFALWVDVSKRFPVDDRRVYATGFSGGARVASVFPRVVGRPIAGVIGCGAGLASGLEPGALGAAAYFGLAGFADFNYGEMKALDRSLDPSGIPHRFHYFEGSHAWPDPASCARAVAWMEIVAMKQGLRPADRERAAAFVRRDLEEAKEFEEAGRVFWAAERLGKRRAPGGGPGPGPRRPFGPTRPGRGPQGAQRVRAVRRGRKEARPEGRRVPRGVRRRLRRRRGRRDGRRVGRAHGPARNGHCLPEEGGEGEGLDRGARLRLPAPLRLHVRRPGPGRRSFTGRAISSGPRPTSTWPSPPARRDWPWKGPFTTTGPARPPGAATRSWLWATWPSPWTRGSRTSPFSKKTRTSIRSGTPTSSGRSWRACRTARDG